jgi:glycosyltransferase involved in cell wall biosynthesis
MVARAGLTSTGLEPRERILIVGAFPPPSLNVFGGVVTVCRNLVQSSLSDVYDLDLVDTTQKSNPPPGLIRRTVSGCIRALKYLKAVMDRPDAVILFCSMGLSAIEKGLMARLARSQGLPVFIFPQSGRLIDVAQQSRLGRLWVGWALRSGTHMLCQGPAWHRFATEDLGYSPDRAPVVPNWTATEDLLDIGRSRRWVDDVTGELNLLFLGWVEREKGIFELLEACRALSDRYAFRLTIAGKGRAEHAVKDFVAEHGLANRVAHVGWMKGEGLLRVLENADVLVLPSWAEGLPNAMIEGMAAGLAVVVSSVGNVLNRSEFAGGSNS